MQEELEEVAHLIDDAAALEDKAEIDAEHAKVDAVRTEAERHPEHDW